jgi:DNA-directed RNA polymerase subunit N (RpoN/RPB10)
LEEIIFENFNIAENNIISVELAKELGYKKYCCGGHILSKGGVALGT